MTEWFLLSMPIGMTTKAAAAGLKAPEGATADVAMGHMIAPLVQSVGAVQAPTMGGDTVRLVIVTTIITMNCPIIEAEAPATTVIQARLLLSEGPDLEAEGLG